MSSTNRFGAPPPRRRLGAAIVSTLCAVVLVLALVATFSEPSTVLSAVLRTEAVTLRVMQPSAARMLLPRARLPGTDECLEAVIVEPARGATVSYLRPRGEAMTVRVDGPLRWSACRAEGGACAAADPPRESHDDARDLGFELSAAPGCAAGARVRLPVHGLAVFGATPTQLHGPEALQLALLGGELVVHARAVRDLGGFPLPRPFRPDALYQANEFTLPGRSILGDAALLGDATAVPGAPDTYWFGFADADLGNGSEQSIVVSASANTGAVDVYLPNPHPDAAAGAPGRPERLSLSLLARLAGDPNLLILYGGLGLLALVVGLRSALLDWIGKDSS